MNAGTRLLTISLSILLVTGCSRKPNNTVDPYEKYNRSAFAMTQAIDKVSFKPVAVVYNNVLPPPLKTGISNVFNNAHTTTTIVNDILQAKLKFFIYDLARMAVNTTLGIGGLFDVVSKADAPRHQEDFGLTLAQWGAKRSPYLITPILGFPSTFRDTFGLPFDLVTQPTFYLRPYWLKYSLYALYFISNRTKLLDADDIINTSFDPYIFVRNAYLQMRNKEIQDNTLSFAAWLKEKQSGEPLLDTPANIDEASLNNKSVATTHKKGRANSWNDQPLPDNPPS